MSNKLDVLPTVDLGHIEFQRLADRPRTPPRSAFLTITMPLKPYPQIIVTGASIAQGSFKTGGFGSILVEEVGQSMCRLETDTYRAVGMLMMCDTVFWQSRCDQSWDVRLVSTPRFGILAAQLTAEYSNSNSRQLLYKLQSDFHVPGDGKVILFVIQVGSNDR